MAQARIPHPPIVPPIHSATRLTQIVPDLRLSEVHLKFTTMVHLNQLAAAQRGSGDGQARLGQTLFPNSAPVVMDNLR